MPKEKRTQIQVLISSIRLVIHIIGWEFLFKKQSNSKLCLYYYIVLFLNRGKNILFLSGNERW